MEPGRRMRVPLFAIARTRRGMVVVALGTLLLTAGCGTASVPFVSGPAEDPALLGEAVAVRPATTVQVGGKPQAGGATTSSGRQVATVTRGSITESLSVPGQVAATAEVPLSFAVQSRINTVSVKPGQAVAAGTPLVELDSKQIVQDLATARARLEVSEIRLQQAEAGQRAAERQGQVDQTRRQTAVSDAEAALRQAQAELERVKAGPSPADRQAADAAVAAASVSVERLDADLARVSAGPTDADVRAAEQQVTATSLALQRAEAEVARLKRGPDPNDLRTAEREAASAQAALERARTEFDRLTRGPDPLAVRAAEGDVERAQASLRSVEATRAEDGPSKAAREAALVNARRTLQEAQDRLGQVRQGPAAAEVEQARLALQVAQINYDGARDRLGSVKQGPDQLTVESAAAAVDAAQGARDAAQARLDTLQAGANPDQVSAARGAADAARSALEIARARQADLNGRPTAEELRAAEGRVVAAASVLERARADTGVPPDGTTPAAFDLLLLQKSVQQDRAQVALLEQNLEETRLLAPFDGTVASVPVRSGDPVEPERTVVVLARPGELIARAELGDSEAARLAVGQKATARLDGSSQDLEAVVTDIQDAPGGLGRTAQFRVTWPSTQPALGAAIELKVTVQQKNDVLLVPQKSVRSAGVRRYVEYMDGTVRRVVNVDVGIVSGGNAEILSGLREGQEILART